MDFPSYDRLPLRRFRSIGLGRHRRFPTPVFSCYACNLPFRSCHGPCGCRDRLAGHYRGTFDNGPSSFVRTVHGFPFCSEHGSPSAHGRPRPEHGGVPRRSKGRCTPWSGTIGRPAATTRTRRRKRYPHLHREQNRPLARGSGRPTMAPQGRPAAGRY